MVKIRYSRIYSGNEVVGILGIVGGVCSGIAIL